MSTAFDYSGLKATADRLIERFGQAIVLTRAARGGTVLDPLDPWEQDQGPLATSAAQRISGLFGVQIAPDSETLSFQTVERLTARWVFQASDAIPEDVGTEWALELVETGVVFEVLSTRPLRPGPTLLTYFAVVAI